jgi:hypothetical protein
MGGDIAHRQLHDRFPGSISSAKVDQDFLTILPRVASRRYDDAVLYID